MDGQPDRPILLYHNPENNPWFCRGINYPFPKRQILDSFKLRETADDNFKFDEIGRQFSKWVENTVAKGEIARYEQFLLFLSVFKRLVLHTHKSLGLFGKGLYD